MTKILNSDKPDLVATNPDHCLDCFRLIRPGEIYHQGKDGSALCPTCVSDLLIGEDFDTLQATEEIAVHYGGGLIRVRREGAAITVAPGEVRIWWTRLLKRLRGCWTSRMWAAGTSACGGRKA